MPSAARKFGATAIRHSTVVPDFFSEAQALRAFFNERFATPRTASRQRFVWDYWHIPGQYTYLRTFAEYYFPRALYRSFVNRMQSWGRDTLGCDAIGVPWLSYYVDGCGQELHADVPHGPWAYVFSITDWEQRRFSGGETLLLRPERLDFWRGFDDRRALESNSILERIPPRFNQLTVFDARIPHGVFTVHGNRDPLESRVVLHGWFRDPEIVASESLRDRHSARALEAALLRLREGLRRFDRVAGLLTIRIEIGRKGAVKSARALSNTLVSTDGAQGLADEALKEAAEVAGDLRFPDETKSGWAILPLRFPIGERDSGDG